MWRVFNKQQLIVAINKYTQRRFKLANPETMGRLLYDFLTSEEFQKSKMLKGIKPDELSVDVCEVCGKPIPQGEVFYSTGTGIAHKKCYTHPTCELHDVLTKDGKCHICEGRRTGEE